MEEELAKRVQQLLFERKDEIEAEVLRRVEEAKKVGMVMWVESVGGVLAQLVIVLVALLSCSVYCLSFPRPSKNLHTLYVQESKLLPSFRCKNCACVYRACYYSFDAPPFCLLLSSPFY